MLEYFHVFVNNNKRATFTSRVQAEHYRRQQLASKKLRDDNGTLQRSWQLSLTDLNDNGYRIEVEKYNAESRIMAAIKQLKRKNKSKATVYGTVAGA